MTTRCAYRQQYVFFMRHADDCYLSKQALHLTGAVIPFPLGHLPALPTTLAS
jgi:hypothetical protein